MSRTWADPERWFSSAHMELLFLNALDFRGGSINSKQLVYEVIRILDVAPLINMWVVILKFLDFRSYRLYELNHDLDF